MTRMDSAAIGVFLSLAMACGGNGVDLGDGGTDAGAGQDVQAGDAQSNDAASDVTQPVDAGPYGQPSSTYPAFTPWMGQLSKNGGPILTAPVIVTITWDVDTGRSTFESFGDQIGGSTYWSAAVGEYGVGASTSGTANHIHLSTTPPSQWTDSNVQSFINQNLGGILPAPTSQTIYVFYIATGTTFIFGNQNACGSI